MALQFNPFVLASTGFTTSFANNLLSAATPTIRVYPDTEPFPASPIENTTLLPATHILTISGCSFGVSGGTYTITAGTPSANTTAGGTFGWFALYAANYGTYTHLILLSDSIGVSGGSTLLGVSTLTPSNGQLVTVTFNLKFS